jgi:hypothetical protein
MRLVSVGQRETGRTEAETERKRKKKAATEPNRSCLTNREEKESRMKKPDRWTYFTTMWRAIAMEKAAANGHNPISYFFTGAKK